jgi:UDP-glucose 6-dehydrogenase
MKTIGVLINKVNNTSAPLVSSLFSELQQKKKSINSCIFSFRSMNLKDLDECIMGLGTMVNFSGDMLCFNVDDALMTIKSNRDIKVKYIIHESTIANIVKLFEYPDEVEFLLANKTYAKMNAVMLEDNPRTITEYLDE